MSAASPKPAITYLAQGNIRVKIGSEPPRTVDSAYGNSIREKAVRAQQKHSWKAAGSDGSPFSGAVLWGKAAMNQDVPLAITSICGGKDPGELVYSLESGSLCALLQIQQSEERRLWNDNRTRIRHISVSRETGNMAFSVIHENGTANIGVKLAGESGIQELTEGDSFDTAPRWMPGPGRRIVYQSAGIGRDREGHFLKLGPFSIEQLDPDTGELVTVLEDRAHDYLAPQCLADGSLYYIRRPYAEHERLHPVRTVKEILLIPFRLLYAVFQFFNVFSAMFTGRKLVSSDRAKARQMDMKQMMIWGNLVRAQTPSRPEAESVDLVPKSWQLHRRTAAGETKELAGGVLAYDISADGSIVYTNGNAIFLLQPDGRVERLLNEAMIEQVFFLGGEQQSNEETKGMDTKS
jgi:hypothetical protein